MRLGSVHQFMKEVHNRSSTLLSNPRTGTLANDCTEYLKLFDSWVEAQRVPVAQETVREAWQKVPFFSKFVGKERWMLKRKDKVQPLLFAEDEATALLFLRVCLESVIEHYMLQRAAPTSISYQRADAFGQLVAYCFRPSPKQTAVQRSLFLTRTLSVMTLLLYCVHETKRGLFDQRPYFRILHHMLALFENETQMEASEQQERLFILA